MRNSLKIIFVVLVFLAQAGMADLWAQYDKDVFLLEEDTPFRKDSMRRPLRTSMFWLSWILQIIGISSSGALLNTISEIYVGQSAISTDL